jgi:hypothetical protein
MSSRSSGTGSKSDKQLAELPAIKASVFESDPAVDDSSGEIDHLDDFVASMTSWSR